MSPAAAARCQHDMLPGQCAPCSEARARRKSLATPEGRAATPQMRRLIEALLVQRRGTGRSKAARKAEAASVREAEALLNKADRRLAQQIATERQPRLRPTRAQLVHGDKLAGVHRPWVSPQNVGRGKRS
jgi:hypothetical protein